ncbi:MAG: hypothetical protein HC837_02805 [Chloroflexaceae bacterium]|nr:hypothetical protein [Chloroflexaceae bacterium]
MYLQHSEALWHQFPQLVVGVLVIDGIHPHVESGQHQSPWLQQARERLTQTTESTLPSIRAWRQAYTQMGLKPTQYRSAAEALLRRFRRDQALPQLHPLVDLGNAISLAFALPVAIFDLDQIAEYLEIRHATGHEEYLTLNGDHEHPDPGEIIFADAQQHAHARRWTFRQSGQSAVRDQTSRVLIISEALHDEATADISALIDALAQAISDLWTPPQTQGLLSASAPRITF